MSRTHMLLVFVAAGVVATVAGVITALVVTSQAHDDTRQHERAAADATATQFVQTHGIKTSTPFELSVTPTSPGPLLGSESSAAERVVTIMFCEPVREPGGTRVATIPSSTGAEVSYTPGGCESDVDPGGRVSVLLPDGSFSSVAPAYVDASAAQADSIVWTPAKGTLHGAEVVMTGRFLRDAGVTNDSLGAPMLRINMTDDGRQVFGSLSERLIGYPLATFVDGQPLRGEHGQILAPTILSRIEDTIMITGLGSAEAVQIAAWIDNGLAH